MDLLLVFSTLFGFCTLLLSFLLLNQKRDRLIDAGKAPELMQLATIGDIGFINLRALGCGRAPATVIKKSSCAGLCSETKGCIAYGTIGHISDLCLIYTACNYDVPNNDPDDRLTSRMFIDSRVRRRQIGGTS